MHIYIENDHLIIIIELIDSLIQSYNNWTLQPLYKFFHSNILTEALW